MRLTSSKSNIMTANEILSDLNLTIGTASKRDIIKAYNAANEEFTIQAWDMVKIMGHSDPTKHTTTSLKNALIWLGCKKA